MMGGALGLAVLASLAAWRTGSVEATSQAAALNSGYHLAFLVGAVFAGLASVLAVALLRDRSFEPQHEGAPVLAAETE
jgi:uncharacterized membrane protein